MPLYINERRTSQTYDLDYSPSLERLDWLVPNKVILLPMGPTNKSSQHCMSRSR